LFVNIAKFAIRKPNSRRRGWLYIVGAMHFILFYDVVADYVERRAAFRAEHLALARAAHARGELFLAGALAEPADGAVFIFTNESSALAFAAADPYVINDLVTSWRVRKWTTVVGDAAATKL
jgi:uncharacterized protein